MAHNDESSAIDKLSFLLIGAGIGATLALLFAPKSGRELRGDIADYTRRGVDLANERARLVGERAAELYETGQRRASELYEAGRTRVADVYGTAREKVAHGAEAVTDVAARQKEQIAAAIEAGKQAYREEKRKAGELASHAAVEGDEA